MTARKTLNVKTSKDLRRALERMSDLTPILDGLGALLVMRVDQAFENSGRDKPWPARLTPNVPAIIQDLNSGGTPKARRFERGQPLVDTGTLRRSFVWDVSSRGRQLVVGTSVPYAKLHNEGGTSTVELTKQGRRNLYLWLKADKSRKQYGLGFLFRQPKVTIKVRRREFLAIGPSERKLIKETIEEGLVEYGRL